MRTNEQNKIRREFRAQRFITRTLPVLLVAAVVVFGVVQWVNHRPITVYVNDTMVELRGERTAEHAVQMSGVKVTPGNLLDVEGEVLTEGGGTPYTLTVDGEVLDDPTADLHNGDKVSVSDGVDIEEESVTQENGKLPNQTREEGIGPIHAIQQGKQGIGTIKTGKVSGKVVVVSVEQEPTDTVYLRYFPNVGDDKVVALTFDDGPVTSNGQTEELLDVLKDNGAKATFFTIGNQIEGAGVDAVIRMHEEGHQVCTHTWDHADGSGQGVNLSYMTPEEQREEVEKGIRAIADAIGEEPSRAMRAPGGNFPIEVWENVDDLITADLGWNVDTMDWSQPGSSYIAEQIKSAQPGDIILMHDGGGDRSQTIEALREALPYLREQGYQFITIDELLQYPPHEDNGQAPEA